MFLETVQSTPVEPVKPYYVTLYVWISLEFSKMINILNWLKISLKSQQQQPNANFSDLLSIRHSASQCHKCNAAKFICFTCRTRVQDFMDRQVRSPEVQDTWSWSHNYERFNGDLSQGLSAGLYMFAPPVHVMQVGVEMATPAPKTKSLKASQNHTCLLKVL